MKKFTKLLGIVLIMALVMSISVSAFAATITINQPTPSDGTAGAETYVAYKIFDVNGNQINKIQRGINIIKMSDGTTKKIVVK